MNNQVSLDIDECIGCQNCVELCPEVFAFDEEEEKAYVLDPDGGDLECAEEAADACPASCIDIE